MTTWNEPTISANIGFFDAVAIVSWKAMSWPMTQGRIEEVGAHPRGVAADLLRLAVAAAERGERHGPHLDRPPDVEDLLHGDLVDLDDVVEHHREHARIHCRDARPAAVADVDQVQRRHRAEGFADDRARDVEFGGERGFAGKRIAGGEVVRRGCAPGARP